MLCFRIIFNSHNASQLHSVDTIYLVINHWCFAASETNPPQGHVHDRRASTLSKHSCLAWSSVWPQVTHLSHMYSYALIFHLTSGLSFLLKLSVSFILFFYKLLCSSSSHFSLKCVPFHSFCCSTISHIHTHCSSFLKYSFSILLIGKIYSGQFFFPEIFASHCSLQQVLPSICQLSLLLLFGTSFSSSLITLEIFLLILQVSPNVILSPVNWRPPLPTISAVTLVFLDHVSAISYCQGHTKWTS